MAYRLRGCWACGAHGPCLPGCGCAKCVDANAYFNWRLRNRDAYVSWLSKQILREGEVCTCPSCGPVPVGVEVEVKDEGLDGRIRKELERVGLKFKGEVEVKDDEIAISNFRDWPKLTKVLKDLGVSMKIRVVGSQKPSWRAPWKDQVAYQRRHKRQQRFVKAKSQKLGMVILPTGVSRPAWPAAWISREELAALESADIPAPFAWP